MLLIVYHLFASTEWVADAKTRIKVGFSMIALTTIVTLYCLVRTGRETTKNVLCSIKMLMIARKQAKRSALKHPSQKTDSELDICDESVKPKQSLVE